MRLGVPASAWTMSHRCAERSKRTVKTPLAAMGTHVVSSVPAARLAPGVEALEMVAVTGEKATQILPASTPCLPSNQNSHGVAGSEY